MVAATNCLVVVVADQWWWWRMVVVALAIDCLVVLVVVKTDCLVVVVWLADLREPSACYARTRTFFFGTSKHFSYIYHCYIEI